MKLPCILYYEPEELCLGVNVRNGDGDMVAVSCEELRAQGRCPKKNEIAKFKKRQKLMKEAIKTWNEK